jgi:DNA modification methylase
MNKTLSIRDLKKINHLPLNTIINGDCEKILSNNSTFPDSKIDLIVTSPPYADRRKKTYGGIEPEKYIKWFLTKSEQFYRILKPEGTFILNLKEKASNGERDTYVIELILELKKQGWLWTEEFIWHKKNCFPGKWPNRFRNAWEPFFQFNKQKEFKMYQEEVMIPIGEWAENRLTNISEKDEIRTKSKSKSGFGRNVANWKNRKEVYPSNVLHLPTECSNRNHSAVFPTSIPDWFIRLFTKSGDVVLDPFLGSGTTALAAKKLKRNYIGIDIKKEYCELSKNNLEKKGR